MFIIIIGDPHDGFEHIGPFETVDDASTYAEARYKCAWWIAALIVPEKE